MCFIIFWYFDFESNGILDLSIDVWVNGLANRRHKGSHEFLESLKTHITQKSLFDFSNLNLHLWRLVEYIYHYFEFLLDF